MVHYSIVAEQDLATPLLVDGWVGWNERTFGVSAMSWRSGGHGTEASLDALLYLDKRGRVVQPPLNPYLPVVFSPTPTTKVERVYGQWVELAGGLAEAIAARGIGGRINLPPTFVDARPFQWAGLQAEWRYTFVADLGAEQRPDPAVRKRLRKAETTGYKVDLGGEPDELHACLVETERRKGFAHQLTRADLGHLARALGPANYRVYIVRDSSGAAVSGGSRLLSVGGWGIDWVQGTSPVHLDNGANQLMYREVMRDLRDAGVRLFDLGGANITSVSRAKSSWGAPLVPYISLSSPSPQAHLRQAAVSSLGSALPVLRHARSVMRRRR